MSLYDDYKHLLGRKYVDGKQDCYGLLVSYYKDNHGILLKNFARPNQYWYRRDFNLIDRMVFEDSWIAQGLNVRHLQIGDALLFAIQSQYANHIGVYVGNGMFIHHLYGRFSSAEALTDSWSSRLLMVVRHKDFKVPSERIEISTLLPGYVKRAMRIDS